MPDRIRARLFAAAAVSLVSAPFVVGLSAAGAEPDRGEVFAFQDPEIVESSGLVVRGDRAFTTNDSGDTGRVFTVDVATGETTGVTYWADGPEDVEALAPAGDGRVWVGDIGDNSHSRPSIQVTSVPVGDGERTVEEETIDLVYPDGAHDAEALLAHPRTGRLYVVTKGVFGGEIYAAPPEMAPDAPNMLGLLGQTPGLVTDGAFFPDGRHLILRTYSSAVVYSFPDLDRVGSFDLPAQQQGEGLAVTSAKEVYVSSEGQRAPVLRVPLPREVRAAMRKVPSQSPAAPGATPTTSTDDTPLSDLGTQVRGDAWRWLGAGVLLIGVLLVLVRALRPR